MDTALVFIVLISLSAFFSGVEIAYFSLSSGKVRTMVRHHKRWAHLVEKLKSRPRKLLIAVLIGNNLVNIFAAAVATELAISLFGSSGVGIAAGVVTFLILVFGEIFPKTIAQHHAGKISRLSAPVIFAIMTALAPVIWIFEQITNLISFGHSPKTMEMNSKITEEEIRSLFQIGVEEGTIEHHEKEFAERLFRFNDVPVTEVMKPLEHAVMLNGEATIESVLEFAAHSGYSRFPVRNGRNKDIIGVVHIKDIAKAISPEERARPVSTLARPPVFVSAEDKLDDVFRIITKNRVHYILVRNKAGKIVGLVTLEDIIEELVGEIYDESDKRKKGLVT